MSKKEIKELKDVFSAALSLERISMKDWCKEKGIVYKSLRRWLCEGFPSGKKRKAVKGKQALQKVLETIDKAGLSDKIDSYWRSYYDFDS